MKASELMIGDWVCTEHDAIPRQIDWIRTGEVGLLWNKVVTPPYLVPIPLTPEILEKNFRVVERSSDGYNLVINSELILAFHLKATLDFWIAQPRDCPNLTYSLPLPKYVHELQHALRLCGIKKEISLC